LAVVAGPTGFAAVGSAIADGWLAPADTDVALRTRGILLAYVESVAALLVTALFGAVALRDALTVEVPNLRLDRAVVPALARNADVARGTIDERAQVHAHARRRWLRDARVRAVGRRTGESLAVMSRRAVAVVDALAGLCCRQDCAV
jgi:hypothetical protein